MAAAIMAELAAIGDMEIDRYALLQVEPLEPGLVLGRAYGRGEFGGCRIGGVARNRKAAVAADKGVGHVFKGR
jgi:hypothetical protein